jgi:hypothetical protein
MTDVEQEFNQIFHDLQNLSLRQRVKALIQNK